MSRPERPAPGPGAARPVEDAEPWRSLELHGVEEEIGARAPEPTAPFWRGEDGQRHSYCSLRCGLDADRARALREAHLDAICRIAAAALVARDQGDQRETARLAMAAARLCEEIAGHWPPSAVEVPKR